MRREVQTHLFRSWCTDCGTILKQGTGEMSEHCRANCGREMKGGEKVHKLGVVGVRSPVEYIEYNTDS